MLFEPIAIGRLRSATRRIPVAAHRYSITNFTPQTIIAPLFEMRNPKLAAPETSELGYNSQEHSGCAPPWGLRLLRPLS